MKRTREQLLRKELEEQKRTNVMLQQELYKIAHEVLTLRGELAGANRAYDKARLECDELREKLRYTNQWPAQGTSVRPPDPPHCRCTLYPQAVPGRTAASLAEENAALRALVRVLLEAKP